MNTKTEHEMQVEIVTLREALKEMTAFGVEFDDERLAYMSVQINRESIKDAQAALSSTSDYAGKVVVDKETFETYKEAYNERLQRAVKHLAGPIDKEIARLDSIRGGGG